MIEKKLILCGILAVAIGIATVVPMEYLMSAQTQANAEVTFDKPWFNVNIPYAFWTVTVNVQKGTISYGEDYYIALNITTNPDVMKTLPDGRLEYYQIKVYSDLGSIENFTYVICANSTGSTNPYITLTYTLENYFNAGDGFNASLATNNVSAVDREFIFFPNFNGSLPATNQAISQIGTSYTLTSQDQAISSIAESINGIAVQGINMTGSSIMDQQLKLFYNIQDAQKIYIDISRIGYVTMDGDFTIVTPAENSIVQQVVLTPYPGGFLYNTVIPQKQLAQTNLLAPSFP